MAGGIAHEVNNPLAVMTLNIESLRKILEKHKATLEEAAFLKLDKLGRSTQRIRSIVMGLKSFSQQSDQMAFEQVTVQKIVDETLEFCNEKIRNSGIEFSVQMEEGEVFVSVRPVQISQIILNLLNNAVDAIKDTKSPKIILSVSKHNESVYIDVTDSGTGVPEHIKQKLFLPFVTSKEVGKGTGLGLSISRGLARDHKGELELLNGAGGATFRLILPLSKTESVAGSDSIAA